MYTLDRNVGHAAVGDPSCKLCGGPVEDALHFISYCPSLTEAREALLRDAPVEISSMLLNPLTHPIRFADHMLGTCWIDNDQFQSFCIEFLHRLRLIRYNLLFNSSGPTSDNSPISGGKK